MTADLHTLTGAYAAYALDDLERAQFEAHLRECRACRDEVRELTATTARLAAGVAADPPPDLRDRVLSEIARTRQLPPSASSTAGRSAAAWYRQPASIAAALMLVVSAALGAVAVQAADRASDAERRADLVTAIATDPERITADVKARGQGHGVVIAAQDAAIFRSEGLAELPEGQVYQLWVIRSTGPESAGVLGRGGELEALVEDMADARGLGLTIEPDGGSDRPSDRLVLRVLMA